jgi:hypothetical protein
VALGPMLRLKKSRAILLLPVSAFMACSRVNFALTFTSQKTVTVIKTKELMLLNEIITVYCKNCVKYIYACKMRGENAEFSNVQ